MKTYLLKTHSARRSIQLGWTFIPAHVILCKCAHLHVCIDVPLNVCNPLDISDVFCYTLF